MTEEQAERERAAIRDMAIAHDAGRVFPQLPPEAVQAVRQRMPGLREEPRPAAAA